jgi:hypothetical protein
MYKILMAALLLLPSGIYGQSKSITRFRADHPENSNLFFYRSTLRMLNMDNSPEITDLLKDIEEIRVLNYDKGKQDIAKDKIRELRDNLQQEGFNTMVSMQDKGSHLDLFNRQKHGKTIGFVAIVEGADDLVLIDLVGSIDVKKFMELKQKLDMQMSHQTN